MKVVREITHTLWFKLTAAFLLITAVGIIIVAVLANRATAVGFHQYLNQDQAVQWQALQTQLADHYTRHNNWDGATALLSAVQSEHRPGNISFILLDEFGETVAITQGQRARQTTLENADATLPIMGNGRQVATLLIRTPGSENGSGRAGEKFLAEVNRAIWWGGSIAVLLALFLGLFLARRLTQPLRQVTQASRKMADGKLNQQVHIKDRGEIGQLAASFNQMSTALANAEQQRQQMLADIAHELRTPLSITRGHIEGMLDGVFEMTHDNLALIHEETLLLGRLITDLRTLSLAEAGQLSLDRIPINLSELTSQAVAAFEPLAEAEGIRLTAVYPPDPITITADANRIRQLLGNLLSNALRHVVQGGVAPQVTITLSSRDDFAQISVRDNGPGLSSEAQAHVFDRFWRADNGRSRDGGGSGLGLAICRAIVKAHNGRIWVESTPGESATFSFTLPITPPETR